MSKFNFPQVKEVRIRNFSLYSKNDKIINIDEKITSGIYCLAGANGLGKTTFQNIINYTLTGIVLAPKKDFLSPDRIFKENNDFTKIYFDGRIKAKEKKTAEVELIFTVNNKYYRLVRGFFDNESLQELEIYELNKNKKTYFTIKKNSSKEYLNKIYQEELVKDIGIQKFEYFVFLQLYVFTFHENRSLLFWDKHALPNALSISFTNNLNDAENLIKIMKNMGKYESDARNYRWQARQLLDEINKLSANNKKPNNKEKKDYIDVCNKFDEIQINYDNLSIEYDTLMNKRNNLYSEIYNLETSYKEYLSSYSEPKSKLLNNPYIQIIKDRKECLICGAKGVFIVDKITENICQDNCPLCNISITEKDEKRKNIIFKKLEKIDNEITKKRKDLENIFEEITEKDFMIKTNKIELEKYQKIKDKMERDCPHIFTSKSDLDANIERLREQYNEYDRKSKDSYEKRDRLKPKYNILEKKVKKIYNEAEIYFVPVFKKLAKNFMGYDLEIKLVSKSRKLLLILELEASARPESHKLSESQRFFLDIALRMAFAIYLSNSGDEATLFIDTPEGSLDIAYENRVGKMFAEFINSYSQNILMSTNINSSQLLVSLANNIKKGKMNMRRMLDWTDLSIVQSAEDRLFKQYYNNIESILRNKK